MDAGSFRRGLRAALAALGGSIALALAAADSLRPDLPPPVPQAPSRGALLYDTHCVECHTAQVHWRARQQASDWATLKAQVRQWQAAARLDWTEADVDAVADHLNDTIYHFARPQEQARRRSPAPASTRRPVRGEARRAV